MHKLTFFILLLSLNILQEEVFPQSSFEVKAIPTSCPGINDGTIQVSSLMEEFPLIVKIFRDWNGTLVQSVIIKESRIYTVNNLQAGKYWIKQMDDKKTADSTLIEITEPKPLNTSKIVVVKLPSGEDKCDGIIKAIGVGGTAPYTYEWRAVDSDQQQISEVCWGIYQCMINDANNCGPVKADIPLYNQLIDKLEFEPNSNN